MSARTSTEIEQLAVALLCLDLQKRKRLRAIDHDRPVVAEARATIHIAVLQFLQMLGVRLAMAARGMHVAVKLHKAAADDHELTAAIEAADYEGLRHQVEPRLGKIAKDGARAGLDQVGADVDRMLSQVNAQAVVWAGDRAGELITSVSDTTRERVRGLVADAIREGWSNEQLADALLGDDAFSGARAEMVARTESAAADVAGNLIGWKESGVVASKEWKVGDGCCDLCQDLDGEVVGIDEEFEEGDPPLHPNCRCTCLPVLGEPDAE